MFDIEKTASDFRKILQGKVLINEPMSRHTSFRIGGPADIIVIPGDKDDVSRVLQYAEENNCPLTVIGNGSNLLVRDGGIRGIVLKLGNALRYCTTEDKKIVCGSGLSLASASRYAYEQGLKGMEFAVGIPGSIGGAVYMNAGAYDGEMAFVVEAVTVMDLQGKIKKMPASDLDFSYRHSVFQEEPYIILEVTLSLKAGDKEEIAAKMADFSERRRSKQPLEMPSAGSTFRRPEGYYVGPLIEKAGLKGYSVGGAQVSVKHAGFLVNKGGATARDVLQLIGEIQDRIRRDNSVYLQPEVMVLGEEAEETVR